MTAAAGDLREDLGDDVLVGLVATDVGGHREPENSRLGQIVQVVGVHAAKPLRLGRPYTQHAYQRIHLGEHLFGGPRRV